MLISLLEYMYTCTLMNKNACKIKYIYGYLPLHEIDVVAFNFKIIHLLLYVDPF